MPEDSVFMDHKKERDELRRQIKETAVTMPSMGEMLQNAAEGYNATVRYRGTLAVEQYQVPDAKELMGKFSLYGDLDREPPRFLANLKLRGDMRNVSFEPMDAETTKREVSFRQKEECYKKKNRKQEEEARQRNEAFSDVEEDELEEQAEDLKAELARDLEAEGKTDSYQLALREYQKKFLPVVEDLIKTRASKGKWFGNYDSHIALAEEKYRFYTEERERLIGEEQAGILMKTPQYETELARAKTDNPAPETDLTRIASLDLILQTDDLDPASIEVVKKAMKEYSGYASKIYELKMQINALNSVWTAEDRDDDSTDFPLHRYQETLVNELKAYEFHAEASLLCVKHVCVSRKDYSYNDEGVRTMTGMHEGMMVAHAAFIKKHYGVDVGQFDPAKKLSDQSAIARSVGLEGMNTDVIRAIDRHLVKDSHYVEYFRQKWSDAYEGAKTGYELQAGLERRSAEEAALQLFNEFAKEELAKKPAGQKKLLSADEMDRIMERCVKDLALINPLPDVTRKHHQGEGIDFIEVTFSGHRDRRGEFETAAPHVLLRAELQAQKARVEGVRKRMGIIRDMNADPGQVTEAISGMLSLVEDSFSDIDAFMNVGDTREIFTAKTHEEVFFKTAGMPSFERKARELRDVISLMLQRSDTLEKMGSDARGEDLQKGLMKKWLFLNRALGYVDYRRQVMEKGYSTAMEDWLDDPAKVEDFWTGGDHTSDAWDLLKGRFVPKIRKQAEAAEADAAAAAAVAEEEEEDPLAFLKDIARAASSVAAGTAYASSTVSKSVDAASSSVSETVNSAVSSVAQAAEEKALKTAASSARDGEESGDSEYATEEDRAKAAAWQRSMDEIHRAELERKNGIDAALEGLTLSQRRFVRMDYYEGGRFSTAKEQADAIRADLRKGSEMSSLIASYHQLTVLIFAESDRLRRDPGSREAAERKQELERQRDEIQQYMDDTEADIERRVLQLIGFVKKPDTFDQLAEEEIETLRKEINDPAIASVTDEMRNQFRQFTDELKRLPKERKRQEIKQHMRGLLSRLERTYIETANAHIDALIADLRNNRFPVMDDELKEQIGGIITAAEKRRNRTSPDSVGQVAALLRSSYYKISENSINQAPPFPALMDLYGRVKGLADLADSFGKKKTVNFRNWVEVREPLAAKEGEEAWDYTSDEVFIAEEERDTEIRKTQKAMGREADEVAVEEAGRANFRYRDAANGLLIERGRYLANVSDFNGGMMRIIPKMSGPMTKEEKLYFSGLGSLVIPLGEAWTLKEDGAKTLSAEQRGDLNTRAAILTADMKILESDTSRPLSAVGVLNALKELKPMIGEAYNDIGAFLSKEPGSRIIAERRPADFDRLRDEAPSRDNYTDDLEGMSALKVKVEVLGETIGRVLSKQGELSAEEKEDLERKAAKLEELGEFLTWRSEVMPRARGLLRKPKDFVKAVKEDPKSWSHEAFSWN